MSYTHQDEHSAIATALRRLLTAEDLGSFADNLMPSEVDVSESRLLLLRDVFGKLCQAVADDDATTWARLTDVHRILYPPAEAGAGRGSASPKSPPGRTPAAPGASPWAGTSAPAAPSPLPVASMAEQPVVPRKGGLEPNAALASTAVAASTTAGSQPASAMPFQGKRAAPRPVAHSLEPHPDMGGTAHDPKRAEAANATTVQVGVARISLRSYAEATAEKLAGQDVEKVYAHHGIADEAGWTELEEAFQLMFTSDDALREVYRRVVLERRTELEA